MNFARYAVCAEMLTLALVVCGMWGLFSEVVAVLPRPVKWVGMCMLWVLFGVAMAVTINVFLADEPTPGVKVLAVMVAPAAVAGVMALAFAARRPQVDHGRVQVIRNATALAAAVSHIGHLEPCPNPECIRARRELAALVQPR